MRAMIRNAIVIAAFAATSGMVHAADAPRRARMLEPAAPPEAFGLVPDCEERYGADLLRCAPREAVIDRDAYPVVAQRKAIVVHARKPYPQLFSWDYP